MKKLNVYHVLKFVSGKQCGHVVAAHSMLEASKLIGLPYHYMRHYASITGDTHDVETALSSPGTVFYTPEGVSYHSDVKYVAKTGKEG